MTTPLTQTQLYVSGQNGHHTYQYSIIPVVEQESGSLGLEIPRLDKAEKNGQKDKRRKVYVLVSVFKIVYFTPAGFYDGFFRFKFPEQGDQFIPAYLVFMTYGADG